MRVIAGAARGRRLKSVPGTVIRPTSDKVKEAVFSRIGPYFEGGKVLDLFAGTGALGIEALSRGMETGVFVDAGRMQVKVIRENLQRAGLLSAAEVYRNDAERALAVLGKRGMKFDLVLLDPPYRVTIVDRVLERMVESELLAENADVVVEHDASRVCGESFGSLKPVHRSMYGDTAVTYFRFSR